MTDSTITAPPYDSTVEQLYSAANDVEMQDAFPTNHLYLYVVIDTNVLIDYCGIIEQFCDDVEKAQYPIMIIIPSVVLGELDGLKNRPELQWFARQATTWLLKKVKERKTVKLQSAKETLSPGGARTESDEVRKNDLAIRDCCLYFAEKSRGYGALLVTLDKNFNLECHKEGIDVCMPPNPKRSSWSSHLLAQALPVAGVNLDLFHSREAFPRYRPSRTRKRLGQTEGPTPVVSIDTDMMDVDEQEESGTMPEEYVPVHARDSLHAQIAEHFPLVLRDLARRVHSEYGDPLSVSNSEHAPAYRRTAVSSWTTEVCLAYLEMKKPFRREAWMSYFFVRRGENGWRKGQDWAPRMWHVALDMLEEVGKKFNDGPMLSSVSAVRPHVQEVWEAKLRPI